MKTPTLEEVKEYFKNAKEIKGIYTFKIFQINTEKYGVYLELSGDFRQCKNEDGKEFLLWSKEEGYAEIVSYKDTKPNHYPQGYDVIDFVKDNELNFNEGNVIKYVVRARKKGSHIEDLKKAKDYLEREIKHYETITTTKN